MMSSRERALGDVVAGLLDARLDPATDRFDAELAAAEADGRIDAQTARLLRWWQRESLRGLVEHARRTIPTTVVALDEANSAARTGNEESAAAWARAEQPDRSRTIDLDERRQAFVSGLSEADA
jgi:hypothetical protein